MSVLINFVKRLRGNIIPYEDYLVKYIDNFEYLRNESWSGGYRNSLFACIPRIFPLAWHNYMCGDLWDRWHWEPYNHVDYLADNLIKKGGLNK